ncbi:glycoside hydrolase [Pelagerythrobacter rhizovicinus]|uniref:glycoside hydrolase n=1 Tax=Pelagerythrobacter rhizovicinus TaxID=2268576 RepID=UPI001CDC3E08|nr:glycoside hydrolase [Pelagerythrobacter rhizovicinus]
MGLGRSLPALTAALFAVATAGSCAATLPPPPDPLGIDPFYTKYASAQGIPIVASPRVADGALLGARAMIEDMLAYRPDLAGVLARTGYRVAILAEEEAITDLPENAHWTKPAPDDPRLTRCERKHYEERIGSLTDREYWNARARGIGGVHTVGAEEDVLGKRSSRYYGETILVHEFAHNVLDAIRIADPQLYAEVETAYSEALETGLWLDEYASTTVQEYWAEGTQFWFNSNRLAVFDGRRILNHADLEAYDPRLAAVLRQAYGERHRLAADPFHRHPARAPPGPIPENTAEVC